MEVGLCEEHLITITSAIADSCQGPSDRAGDLIILDKVQAPIPKHSKSGEGLTRAL